MFRQLSTPLAAVGVLAAGLACTPEAAPPPVEAPPTSPDESPAELPAALTDPARAPDSELLLPLVEGYATDDDAEVGELESSLDHGSVPYLDLRRRLILDDQGFAVGEVTVVTVPPGSDGAERVLDHRFGQAGRTPVRIAGVEMFRIETDPFPVLAWVEPTYVVTFARGADRTDEWLADFARASLRAISEQEG